MDIQPFENPRKAAVTFESFEEWVDFGFCAPIYSREYLGAQNAMTGGAMSIGMVRPSTPADFPQTMAISRRTLVSAVNKMEHGGGYLHYVSPERQQEAGQALGRYFIELAAAKDVADGPV